MAVENRPEHQRGFPNQPDLEGFDWREDLSSDSQKLYEFLLGDVGDLEILPEFAEKYKFDLEATLSELRSWGILDESNPTIMRVKTHL